MSKPTIGFAMCGSFCTFSSAISEMEKLKEAGYDIIPIMSFNAYMTDTRFGKAKEIGARIEEICGRKIISSIPAAEPIGPKKMCDIIVVTPCTGNTLAKITHGITDTPVTMAVKSHLRIGRPVVITFASNDALGASAQNIGKALNTKHVFFTPLSQDDPEKKPNSLVAHFDKLGDTIKLALEEKQIQPIFC